MKKLIALLLVIMLIGTAASSLAETWICGNCGNESEKNFCSWCGSAKLWDQIVCSNCGAVFDENAGYAFCNNCGAALQQKHAKNISVVTFGCYEQDNNPSNGPEAIEWLVLDNRDGKMLLLSRYGLDAAAYHNDVVFLEHSTIDWETCDLRTWLNHYFYDTAFNEQEKLNIVYSQLDNESNGNDTLDRVFLLSAREAHDYFPSNLDRMCVPTAYALANNAWTSNDLTAEGQEAGPWWLRTIYNHYHANAVGANGECNPDDIDGAQMDRSIIMVRPAVWVDISAFGS